MVTEGDYALVAYSSFTVPARAIHIYIDILREINHLQRKAGRHPFVFFSLRAYK